MAANEQNVSPEEKLLKVIKGETPAKPAAVSPGAPAAASAKTVTAQAPAPVKPPAPAARPAPKPVPAAKPAEAPKPQPAAAVAPKAARKPAPEAAKPPAAAAAAEKPKLKPVKTDAVVGKAPVAGKTAAKVEPPAAAAAADLSPAAPAPVVSAKKRTEVKQFGIRKINLGLAAAVLIMIVFSVNEIFAKIKTDTILHKSIIGNTAGGQSLPVQGGTGSLLPSLDVIMQWIGDLPIVAPAGQKLPAGINNSNVTAPGTGGTVPVADWMTYVQTNIKLMGFSGDTVSAWQEAILQENKDNRLIYVKAGGKLSIPGQDIQVEAIKDEQVLLTDGKRRMTLK